MTFEELKKAIEELDVPYTWLLEAVREDIIRVENASGPAMKADYEALRKLVENAYEFADHQGI